MKATCLLIVFAFVSHFAIAQQRDLQKISALYEHGKYEKALQLIKKSRTVNPRSESFHWIESKILFATYAASRIKSEKTIDRILLLLDSGSTVPQQFTMDDSLFFNGMKLTLRDKVDLHRSKSGKKAKYYTEALALVFSDTVEYYHALHPVTVADLEPVWEDSIAEVAVKKLPAGFVRPTRAPNRDSVIHFAEKFLGTPYRWAGTTPKGFDCSGFVLYVMNRFGYNFYHQSAQIAQLGDEVPIEAAEKGDIVVFGHRRKDNTYAVSHVAILTENKEASRKVIHSVSRGVVVDTLEEGYWKERMLFVKRIID